MVLFRHLDELGEEFVILEETGEQFVDELRLLDEFAYKDAERRLEVVHLLVDVKGRPLLHGENAFPAKVMEARTNLPIPRRTLSDGRSKLVRVNDLKKRKWIVQQLVL